jgi:UDP-N-acetylmuramoyl-L-alanyl-D-glutamate--2,6-diaminopimelate ligase
VDASSDPRTALIPRRVGELIGVLAPSLNAHVLNGDSSVEVIGITQDTNDVIAGDLFCCVAGQSFDGHTFATAAVDKGAVAVLVEREISGLADNIVQIHVSSVREAMAYLASEMYGNPSRELCVVAVTGTNGKTSTASITGDLLRALNGDVAVFGTLTGERTTPEAIEIQRRLAQCRDEGIGHVVMEVSSHALSQSRVKGTRFHAAIFTNLGHDHLDYHRTQEEYFAAKASLFRSEYTDRVIANRDDPHGLMILDTTDVDSLSYGCSDAQDVVVTARSINFEWKSETIRVPIGGAFTVFNVLAAITAVESLGYSPSEIARACENVRPVRGRFELVPGANDFDVVVDYAHTPEGLSEVLKTARALAVGDVLVVFGCGGNRDSAKRPLMGRVAGELADVVVLTADNPRSEDAEKIIADIAHGVSAPRGDVLRIVDRRDAIRTALRSARNGDVVVIAGKGHEKTQEIAGVFTSFDDVSVAGELLQELSGTQQ